MKFVFARKPEEIDFVHVRGLLGRGIVKCTGFGIRKDNDEVINFDSDDLPYDSIKDKFKSAVICVHFEDDPPSRHTIEYANGEIAVYMLEGKNECLQMIIESLLTSIPLTKFFLAMPELNPKEPVAVGVKGLCFVFGGKSFWDGKVTIYEKMK